MPILNTDMDVKDIPGGSSMQYSAVKLDKLGASEYTLVTIAVDVSGSTIPFTNALLDMVKCIIGACKYDPMAENIMIRLIIFNSLVNEVHGFKLLNSISESDYKNFNPSGTTALYDAIYSSIGATVDFAKTLYHKKDLEVKSCCYIITDGYDNMSTMRPSNIKAKIQDALTGEELDSALTVLIGLTEPNDPDTNVKLEELKTEGNLTEYMNAGKATPESLAKIRQFVSKSISHVSQGIPQPPPLTI
jgi:hypothetical protein